MAGIPVGRWDANTRNRENRGNLNNFEGGKQVMNVYSHMIIDSYPVQFVNGTVFPLLLLPLLRFTNHVSHFFVFLHIFTSKQEGRKFEHSRYSWKSSKVSNGRAAVVNGGDRASRAPPVKATPGDQKPQKGGEPKAGQKEDAQPESAPEARLNPQEG